MIEARWLFGLPESRIDVAIHPQSVIHAMVALTDGTLQAQLSPPSMAYPIQDCLLAPDRPPCPAPRLDLAKALSLELLPPDLARYPLLGLARAAARGAPGSPERLQAHLAELFPEAPVSPPQRQEPASVSLLPGIHPPAR